MSELVRIKTITAPAVAAREQATGRWHEIVNGEWLEIAMPSFNHSEIALNIGMAMKTYLKNNPLGKVAGDGAAYVLKGTPHNIEIMRIPDVSFLSNAKVGFIEPDGYAYTAPDIAVEVVSKTETAQITQDKLDDYFQYGTAEVWVVYPKERRVLVHVPDGTSTVYSLEDTLTSETLLPGFQLPLQAIFED